MVQSLGPPSAGWWSLQEQRCLSASKLRLGVGSSGSDPPWLCVGRRLELGPGSASNQGQGPTGGQPRGSRGLGVNWQVELIPLARNALQHLIASASVMQVVPGALSSLWLQ